MMQILLIEDSATQAAELQGQLESLGLQVDVATAVPTTAQEYHAILADLGLKATQGLDTLLCIRRRWPMTPVVVLTAETDDGLHMECLMSGASAVYVKGEQGTISIVRAMRLAVVLQAKLVLSISALLERAKKVLGELDSTG